MRVTLAASVAVHVAVTVLVLSYTGAHLLRPASEAIPISVISPEEAERALANPLKLPEQFDRSVPELRPANSDSETPSALTKHPNASPQINRPLSSEQRQAARPIDALPQPDISLLYQVDLGFKDMATTAPAASFASGRSETDDTAVSKADLDADSVAKLRKRWRDCSTLPASIAPDANIVIVMRATFTPDGRLANAPTLIEASASAKGPALMQAAATALVSCQPYSDFPKDNYSEWRRLDVRFTPRDFRKG